MKLDEAKERIKNGTPCYPSYFGFGWSVVWHDRTQGFYTLNPVTGSMHQHRFEERDEVADWKIGKQKSRNGS